MNEASFQDQVDAYLLGELPPAQAAAFERALTTDGALRGLLRAREADLERLTLEITPQVEPSAVVRDKLLAAAAADVRVTAPPAVVAGWPAFFRPALAMAAVVTLLAVCAGLWKWRENGALRTRLRQLSAENGTLRDGRGTRERLEREATALRAQAESTGRDTAALRERLARTERDLSAAREQDVFTRVQVGALQPPPGAPPSVPTTGGVALWDPQRQEGMLVVENLPVPRPDQDYQVWIADLARPQPVPSGVFHPARAGERATLRFVTNERIERATQFMVTLERKGGVNRITGPAVLESLPHR